MKKLLLTISIILLSTSISFAFSFRPGWESYVGPIKFKYSNWENTVSQQGEILDGIFKIETINAVNPMNTTLWGDGDNGEELTGTFSYVADTFTPVASGVDIHFTGGTFNVYLDDTPDFNATFPGTGVTDGIDFLTCVGVAGIIPGDPTTTLKSSVDQITAPLTGKGSGYLDVIGGLFADKIEPNTYGPGADLFLESDFSTGEFGWPVGSEDPVTGVVVPEPGTLALFGIALISITGILRRKELR